MLLDKFFANGLEAIYLTKEYAVLYSGLTVLINLPVDILTGIFRIIFPATSLLFIVVIIFITSIKHKLPHSHCNVNDYILIFHVPLWLICNTGSPETFHLQMKTMEDTLRGISIITKKLYANGCSISICVEFSIVLPGAL